MRIGELADRSGVPIPTIKYYLREGLLMRGALRAPNQADYGTGHLERLSLIRTLVEVGEMDLAQVRRVVDALADPAISRHEAIGSAFYSLPAGRSPVEGGAEAAAEIARWIRRHGLRVKPEAPALEMLGEAVATLRRYGYRIEPEDLDVHLEILGRLAEEEVAGHPGDESITRVVEQAIVGTVAFEKIIVGLRRLLLEHRSALVEAEH